MSTNIKTPKKLIEVALPLDDINREAAREKSIRHGHPSTLHLWWARRPLAAARAVLFAQMVNDPGGERGYFAGKTKAQANEEREKLFEIIRDLVEWDNSNNEEVLNKARAAISQSWRETCELNKGKDGFDPEVLPAIHDPFAGGGAIPLEAQRLGFDSYASDLNPVAVIINKALIEIPPKFSNCEPIGPIPKTEKQKKLVTDWSGAKGLAEDVRRYGHWIREEAEKRIGSNYPQITITKELSIDRPDLQSHIGKDFKVIAWLWARTVKSSNPAFNNTYIPLVSNFVLSTKKGKEAWVEPIVKDDSYDFLVHLGTPPDQAKNGTKLGRGASFQCIMSGSPIDKEYIREQFQSKLTGTKLMAIVAQGPKGRVYISPTTEHEQIALKASPSWHPNIEMNQDCKDLVSGRGYGIKYWYELFTNRQLLLLSTFSDLVKEVREKIINDALSAGWKNDSIGLAEGGTYAAAYADAIATYCALAISKLADAQSAHVRWKPSMDQAIGTFGRQALPMVWDYAESNPFAGMAGDYLTSLKNMMKVLDRLNLSNSATVLQQDALSQEISRNKVVSTDPPYYDNIAYADLSDYFYLWLRHSLKPIFPNLFATITVPKGEELVASAYRHGSKNAAENFFLNGMTNAIKNIAEQSHPAFPVSIYYAFKQSETKNEGTASTGWETFLEAVIRSGFSITGTWPMRTELGNRMISAGTNALASSIVLICRKRDQNVEPISRRSFQRELREEMPEALKTMIGGSSGVSPIAPVDLAQAAIGPGMAIYSKYGAVLNQDGSNMSVHEALVLINREITEYLNPDSGNFDEDTLFCSGWFDQFGWSTGKFGDANTLAQAKGTTVDGVDTAGVIQSGGGKVRLLKWAEYPSHWDPDEDNRTPVWEALHHMIRVLSQQGETAAGSLLARMPERGESIRQLAYHLYTLCERKKWAEDARAYNELITAWHSIIAASHDVGHIGSQAELEI